MYEGARATTSEAHKTERCYCRTSAEGYTSHTAASPEGNVHAVQINCHDHSGAEQIAHSDEAEPIAIDDDPIVNDNDTAEELRKDVDVPDSIEKAGPMDVDTSNLPSEGKVQASKTALMERNDFERAHLPETAKRPILPEKLQQALRVPPTPELLAQTSSVDFAILQSQSKQAHMERELALFSRLLYKKNHQHHRLHSYNHLCEVSRHESPVRHDWHLLFWQAQPRT